MTDVPPGSAANRNGGDSGRKVAAVAAGAVLLVASVAGLHHLHRAGDSLSNLIPWIALLLGLFTALGGGIKLVMWGLRPVTAAVSDEAKARLSEPVLAVVASGAVVAGVLGMWWTFRGGYASWWRDLAGESQWSLSLGVGQMLVAVAAGAGLLTGGRYVTGLAKEALTDFGLLIERDRAAGRRRAPEGLWHPGLVAALVGGGLGLVLLAAGITPRLYVWITGPDVLPAIAAIAGVLLWGIGSNLGWWKGLAGLWKWATDASQKTAAVAGVVAVLMFQPPSQGGPQMPDYQGGINQPPMDQNSSISIYNTQAPSISNNGANGSSGQQGPQQGWDQPAHGTQIPDYQNATPYTQGPGKPNPDFNGGQANPGTNTGSEGGQPNQGVREPQQVPQQDPAQQPSQSSDQQKIDDLTRQLQDQQRQSGQNRQRIDDLTKQLQQNSQNQKQQSTRFPSKDKKKDDKDEQDDRDKQSGDSNLTALLLGAASTRRRKQDEQQGPDTQALGQDASQAVQGLPDDVQTYVQSGQQIGQSSGQAAQGFGSAAQSGASIASSAQSGAVNPQDAVTVVQGVAQGVQGTADAVKAGTDIAHTGIQNAQSGTKIVGDLNPSQRAQLEKLSETLSGADQVTQFGGQVAELTSQGAGAVNSGASMDPSQLKSVELMSGDATAMGGGFQQAPQFGPPGQDGGDDPIPGSLTDTLGRVNNPPAPEPLPPSMHPTASEQNFTNTSSYIYGEMKHNTSSAFFDDMKQQWDSGLLAKKDSLAEFYEAVKTGGAWDHKPIIQNMVGIHQGDGLYFQQPGTPNQVYYDIYSNVHYGYVARAIGYPRSMIEVAPTLGTGDTGVTDVGDLITVAAGIDMFEKYGTDMTEAQFNQALGETIEKLASAKKAGEDVSLKFGYK
ncbi:polymorphic toxin type 44 domain-containing protein [Mycobacteroides abscessus]|uniref:polymorphic toxin type 44 domain-containing protein n=1 Tax=Mycobacteroides abscessus TaxID=36809 RepID=UPI0037446FBA